MEGGQMTFGPIKNVLLTGAAGRLGGVLREALTGRVSLRLMDLAPLGPARAGEEIIMGDLGDRRLVGTAVQGMDAIIHFAGIPTEAAWSDLLHANVVGTYNVFDAAREQGVRRVLYASSHHAVGYYRRDERIGPNAPPRPDSCYGATKATGELIGSLYADKFGLEVMSIRIGWCGEKPTARRHLATWLSYADLVRLIEWGLTLDPLGYEVVYGISRNKHAWWNNERAHALGYHPGDSADHYADELAAAPAEPPSDALFQGAAFASANLSPLSRATR